MRSLVALLIALSPAACIGAATAPSGSSPPCDAGPEAAPTCAARSGSYLVTWTQLPGGDCGTIAPVAPTVVAVDGVTTASPNCQGGGTLTADGCSEAFAELCPATGWTEEGTIAWSQDGATGSGTIAATYTRQSG